MKIVLNILTLIAIIFTAIQSIPAAMVLIVGVMIVAGTVYTAVDDLDDPMI